MRKVLIVGQTPPPYGGQAIMIDHLLRWHYQDTRIYYVKMNFSRSMQDMGKFQFHKVWHLIVIIIKIFYYRLIHNVSILYYPPSGPNNAVYRDMMILLPTRWMFRKTIFHFHASGLSKHQSRKGVFFKLIFKRCFFYPDVAIRLSESCPDEGSAIFTKQSVIVPNGLPDDAKKRNQQVRKTELNVLFIGLLEESKGEMDLCRAVAMLKAKGIKIKVRVAGEFKTQEYKSRFLKYLKENELEDCVDYLGIIHGTEKDKAFRLSDVFCFPSFFHSESFPLVLIEAMSYGLPIVATRWRGIVDMVEDGVNGYLVKINDPEEVAEKLTLLADNVFLRNEMGVMARKFFEEKYEITQHLKLMEQVFQNV